MRSAYTSIARNMLVDLLRAYSPTGREERAVEVLENYAKTLDYDEVVVDRAGNLLASYGSGENVFAVVGHVDTVAGEIPVRVNEDVIHGRGAVDAKGPLVAAFIGVSLAKRHLDLSKWKVYVVAAVGEESDSRGVKELVNRGFSARGVVVAEPSNNSLVVIGYRGGVKILVECVAEAGHTSSPSQQLSACEKLLYLWDVIKHKFSDFKANGNSAALVGLTCGNNCRELCYQSVYPREGAMIIDVRVSINERVSGALSTLSELVDRVEGCSLRVLDYAEPVRVSPNAPVVRAVVRSILQQGTKPRLVYKLGTSDMNLLYGVARGNIVAYGPGKSELSHSDHEAISLSELSYGIDVYRNTLLNYVKLVEKNENKPSA